MISNSNNLAFSIASFYMSFLPNTEHRKPLGNYRQFLQSPLWRPIEQNKANGKKHPQLVVTAKNALKQAIHVLQLFKLPSLSVLMRCGHVPQLVENWLCSPLEQLKRNTDKNQQYVIKDQRPTIRNCIRSSTSSLLLMPPTTTTTTTAALPSTTTASTTTKAPSTTVALSTTKTPSPSSITIDKAGPLSVVHLENALIPSNHKNTDTRVVLSSLFVHFQIPHAQLGHLEIVYTKVPCLFTVVCATYLCGKVSLSLNQIDLLDFLLSPSTMNPFLVQCNLVPQHPVTVHQLVPSSNSAYHQQLQICDFEDNQQQEEITITETDANDNFFGDYRSTPYPESWIIRELQSTQEEKPRRDLVRAQPSMVGFLHYNETLLYQQEEEEGDDDDDEESGLFNSDGDFSFIDNDYFDDKEEEKMAEEETANEDDHYHKAKAALLELVQDTLNYIESSGGALTDELNNLAPKLNDYCSM